MAEASFDEFNIRSYINPETTLGEIESVISSDFHEDWTWVIVEGSDDVSIYEHLFNSNTTIVRNSIDDKKQCSCMNVEKIVKEILETYFFHHIIGIRDTDYTRYDKSYSVPDNIFLTDDHDIEMQMLNCNDVIQGFKVKKPNIEKALNDAYEMTKHIGYLRAYSISIQSGFSFDGYVKMKNFWNQRTNKPVESWKRNLYQAFFDTPSSSYGPAPSKCNFVRFIHKHNLHKEPVSYVCQGHDVVGYLEWTGAITNPYPQFVKYYNIAAFAS